MGLSAARRPVVLIVEDEFLLRMNAVDMIRAAGFEAVEQRSGYGAKGLPAYVEYRDNRVAMFVRQLARGRHSIAYRMRAEIPGRFAALPTKASAMYAPELKANSDEFKVNVVDAPEGKGK